VLALALSLNKMALPHSHRASTGAAQNYGSVLIDGARCPIRGRVSMEKTVVSVDHLSRHPRVGDTAVLLGTSHGSHGTATITVDDLASAAGTNNYEVLVSALPRLPRHYGGAGAVRSRDAPLPPRTIQPVTHPRPGAQSQGRLSHVEARSVSGDTR
jgi:hypothetical protein